MAFPKRGSRFITVDGVRYRWKMPPSDDYEQDGWAGVGILVSPADCDGAVLKVVFTKNHRLDGPLGDLGWPILPAEVARRVREAVVAGWQIDRPGKQFGIRVD